MNYFDHKTVRVNTGDEVERQWQELEVGAQSRPDSATDSACTRLTACYDKETIRPPDPAGFP
jgi:hypothetical protein